MKNPNNYCVVCGVKKLSFSSFCRTHKWAVQRALRRVSAEKLLVDKAGGAWWVWDAKGEVLVIGQDSRAKALAVLDTGEIE